MKHEEISNFELKNNYLFEKSFNFSFFYTLVCLLGLLSVLQVTYWQYRSIDNQSDDTLQTINKEERRGNELIQHNKLKNTKIKNDKKIDVKRNTQNILNKENNQNIVKSLNTENRLAPTEKKEILIEKKEVLVEKKPVSSKETVTM